MGRMKKENAVRRARWEMECSKFPPDYNLSANAVVHELDKWRLSLLEELNALPEVDESDDYKRGVKIMIEVIQDDIRRLLVKIRNANPEAWPNNPAE